MTRGLKNEGFKSPSMDEWIKKMWYIRTMKYYSALKKKWNGGICSEVDGPRVCHTEWSKSEREKQNCMLTHI